MTMPQLTTPIPMLSAPLQPVIKDSKPTAKSQAEPQPPEGQGKSPPIAIGDEAQEKQGYATKEYLPPAPITPQKNTTPHFIVGRAASPGQKWLVLLPVAAIILVGMLAVVLAISLYGAKVDADSQAQTAAIATTTALAAQASATAQAHATDTSIAQASATTQAAHVIATSQAQMAATSQAQISETAVALVTVQAQVMATIQFHPIATLQIQSTHTPEAQATGTATQAPSTSVSATPTDTRTTQIARPTQTITNTNHLPSQGPGHP